MRVCLGSELLDVSASQTAAYERAIVNHHNARRQGKGAQEPSRVNNEVGECFSGLGFDIRVRVGVLHALCFSMHCLLLYLLLCF